MKIGITGSQGFVGSSLVKESQKLGWEVHEFIRHIKSKHQNTHIHYWDARDKNVNKNVEVDVVVNCAAYTNHHQGQKDEHVAVNINGTEESLRIAPDKPFIQISSGSIYLGLENKTNIPASLLPDTVGDLENISEYAWSKLQAEYGIQQIVETGRSGITVITPHIIYGEGDTTLLPQLLKATRNHTLILPGGAVSTHSVTHIDTLIKSIIQVVKMPHNNKIQYINIADEPVILADKIREEYFKATKHNLKIISLNPKLSNKLVFITEIMKQNKIIKQQIINTYLVKQFMDDFLYDSEECIHSVI